MCKRTSFKWSIVDCTRAKYDYHAVRLHEITGQSDRAIMMDDDDCIGRLPIVLSHYTLAECGFARAFGTHNQLAESSREHLSY